MRDLLSPSPLQSHPEELRLELEEKVTVISRPNWDANLRRNVHTKLTPILPSPILPVCIPRAVSSGSALFRTAVKVALVERLSEADYVEAASRSA